MRRARLLAILAAGLLATAPAAGDPPEKPGAKGQDPSAKSPSAAERENRRKGANARDPDLLKVGDMAPDFSLKPMHGKKDVTLSSHRGKQPVVLIFGSYT